MSDPHLDATLAQLYRRPASGIKFGLETEQELLARLGHPQKKLACIHVAGTNGKGSVCAMLESVFRAAGLKTGLYTSPHLISFSERIKVAGQPISQSQLSALIAKVDAADRHLAAQPGGREATFFEFATAVAFAYFQQQQVELVILETGLGGRLDATNVITPLLSVITGISREHAQYLGREIAAIAREKGGIIKPRRPLVVGALPEAALTEIRRLAAEQEAPLILAQDNVSIHRRQQDLAGQKISLASATHSYGTLTLPLLGTFQLGNAAIALTAAEELARQAGWDLPPATVKRGLETTHWPGRCQLISQEPVMLVDGAHNPEAAGALVQTLKELLPHKPLGLILGMCADKDVAGFLRPWQGLVKHCWTVPLNNERSLAPQELAAQVQARGWPVKVASLPEALTQSRAWAEEHAGAICICGSLFLAGATLALLEKDRHSPAAPGKQDSRPAE